MCNCLLFKSKHYVDWQNNLKQGLQKINCKREIIEILFENLVERHRILCLDCSTRTQLRYTLLTPRSFDKAVKGIGKADLYIADDYYNDYNDHDHDHDDSDQDGDTDISDDSDNDFDDTDDSDDSDSDQNNLEFMRKKLALSRTILKTEPGSLGKREQKSASKKVKKKDCRCITLDDDWYVEWKHGLWDDFVQAQYYHDNKGRPIKRDRNKDLGNAIFDNLIERYRKLCIKCSTAKEPRYILSRPG